MTPQELAQQVKDAAKALNDAIVAAHDAGIQTKADVYDAGTELFRYPSDKPGEWRRYDTTTVVVRVTQEL